MSSTYDQLASDETIQATTESLAENGFEVHVFETKQQAKDAVLAMIPKRSEVFTGTSVTLDQTGIGAAVNGPDYVSLRSKMMSLQDKKQMKQAVAAPDVMLSSVHAITADGKLMIASASGSQLSAEVYGAQKVIFVVGSQKLVKDVADGINRIEQHIVPLEDVRALGSYGAHTNFRKLLVFNNEVPGRITVVIIKESLGY